MGKVNSKNILGQDEFNYKKKNYRDIFNDLTKFNKIVCYKNVEINLGLQLYAEPHG